MGSIYDLNAPPAPAEEIELPTVRSKKREILSSTEVVTSKRRLADLVDKAFNTLNDAMQSADFATAVKASQIVLDRAGFGPKATVDVNATHIDLSSMTREELAARALQIAAKIKGQTDPPALPAHIKNVTPPASQMN